MKRGDTLVLASILLLTLVVAWCFFPARQSALTAVVHLDGEEVLSLPLTGPDSHISIGALEVCYGEGYALVSRSDCRDQVCLHAGRLTRAGQIAVCLPNRFLLEIRGSAGADTDMIIG